jgi:thiamine transport system substrate-binding protein
MQFMVTPAFQNIIPTGNWMYPVIDTTLPAGFEQMTVPQKALQFSAEEVAKHRGDWIRAWQTAVSQ